MYKVESFSDYLNSKSHVSCSILKKYKKSPLHALHEPVKDTEAMTIGRAYHSYVLDPKNFEAENFILNEQGVIKPLFLKGVKKPRATREYKDWYVNQMAEAGDRNIITLEQFRELQAMKDVLFANKFAKFLLTSGVNEVSAYTEIDGVKVKGRFDSVNHDKAFIADLKTVNDASRDGFLKKYVCDFDGHIQAGAYTEIAGALMPGKTYSFYWVAQEKTPPYAVGVYKASASMLIVGLNEFEILAAQYDACKRNGHAGYEVFAKNRYGVIELDLPQWKVKDIEFYTK